MRNISSRGVLSLLLIGFVFSTLFSVSHVAAPGLFGIMVTVGCGNGASGGSVTIGPYGTFHDGQSISVLLGSYAISYQAGANYQFSSWSTTGGLFVVSQNSPSTTLQVGGTGTLIINCDAATTTTTISTTTKPSTTTVSLSTPTVTLTFTSIQIQPTTSMTTITQIQLTTAITTVTQIQPTTVVTTVVQQPLVIGVDNGQGSVSVSGGSFSVGSSVTVTASPSSGWQFSGWSTQTGVSCSSNPCTFNMPNNAVTLRATFVQTVTVTTVTTTYTTTY